MRPTYPSAATLAARRSNARAAADEAMRRAHNAADQLAALLDRHDGDAGEDAALIDAWTDALEALADEVRALVGEPRVMRHGVLVPVGYAAQHTGKAE